MEKTNYAPRLVARIIDLLMVGLVVLVLEKAGPDFSVNLLSAYLFYEIVVAALGGRSLGKYLLSLEVRTNRVGLHKALACMLREPLLLVLMPLIFLNFLGMSPLPLHDRISGTRVVRDDI